MIFLLAIWSKFKVWIIVALAALALLGGAYGYGYLSSTNNNKTKQLEDRVKSVNKAKEVENEVRKMSPSDLDRELERWLRD